MNIAQRGAILRVTPEVLAELLQLPEGSYIDAVQAIHDRHGTLELRIRGAGWLVAPGEIMQRTEATITMLHTIGPSPVIDWGFPRTTT